MKRQTRTARAFQHIDTSTPQQRRFRKSTKDKTDREQILRSNKI